MTELLLADSVETEARAHTRTLGLDTEGDFVALAWPDGANPTAALPAGFLRLEAMGALFALGQFAREVGPLTLRCEKLPVGDSGGQVLVIYHAEPGSVTAQALAELGKRTEADGPTPPPHRLALPPGRNAGCAARGAAPRSSGATAAHAVSAPVLCHVQRDDEISPGGHRRVAARFRRTRGDQAAKLGPGLAEGQRASAVGQRWL